MRWVNAHNICDLYHSDTLYDEPVLCRLSSLAGYDQAANFHARAGPA